MQNKIKELSWKRIKILINKKISFYKWSQTYLDWIKDEVEEVKAELRENNTVYLEDELGDIFWNYLCLLHSLEDEWKITSLDKVFERCYKKFSERVWYDGDWNKDWDEVKKIQKEELKKEHNKFYY